MKSESVFIVSLILTLMQISVSCHTAVAFLSTCFTYDAKVSLDKTNNHIFCCESNRRNLVIHRRVDRHL